MEKIEFYERLKIAKFIQCHQMSLILVANYCKSSSFHPFIYVSRPTPVRLLKTRIESRQMTRLNALDISFRNNCCRNDGRKKRIHRFVKRGERDRVCSLELIYSNNLEFSTALLLIFYRQQMVTVECTKASQIEFGKMSN